MLQQQIESAKQSAQQAAQTTSLARQNALENRKQFNEQRRQFAAQLKLQRDQLNRKTSPVPTQYGPQQRESDRNILQQQRNRRGFKFSTRAGETGGYNTSRRTLIEKRGVTV